MWISVLESVDLIVLRTIQWQSVASDRVALLQCLHRQIGSCMKDPAKHRCPWRVLDVATARVLQLLRASASECASDGVRVMKDKQDQRALRPSNQGRSGACATLIHPRGTFNMYPPDERCSRAICRTGVPYHQSYIGLKCRSPQTLKGARDRPQNSLDEQYRESIAHRRLAEHSDFARLTQRLDVSKRRLACARCPGEREVRHAVELDALHPKLTHICVLTPLRRLHLSAFYPTASI